MTSQGTPQPTPPATVDPATIRTALVELLCGRDHGAAAPEVLAEVGAHRRRHTSEHGTSVALLGDTDRFTVLIAALGPIATAVRPNTATGRTSDPAGLRAGLITSRRSPWPGSTPPPPPTTHGRPNRRSNTERPDR